MYSPGMFSRILDVPGLEHPPPNFYQKANLRDFFNHWLIKGIALPGLVCLLSRCVETKNLEAWKTSKEKQRCNVG